MNSYRLQYRFGLIFFFVASLTVLMSIALGIDGLGPLDDHHFIRTIFQGEPFHAYILPGIGRFIPLTAQEYVFAAKLFHPSASLFHVLSGLKIFLCATLLLHCLMLTQAGNWTVIVVWAATIFSIGFANAGFRLQVGEINALMFLLCFVWSVLISNSGEASPVKHRVATAFGLIAIFLTFFYKEVSFVLAISFGLSELYRRYRQNLPVVSKRILALVTIGIAYPIFYLFWRANNREESYVSYHATSLTDVIQLFASNDPFIFFIVLPITFFRLFIVLRNARKQTVYDSFLIGASAYALAYVVLGIYNTYYLLPAYAFSACGIAGLISLNKNRLKKLLVLFSIALVTLNNLPIAVADMYSLKAISNNHWRFVNFISNWIFSHPLPDSVPRNLVLEGVSPGRDVEVIHSLQTYLESLGLPPSTFKLRFPLESNNKVVSDSYGMEYSKPYEARQGDLLVFNPYQSVASEPPLLTPSYHEVYRSESDWELQRWSGLEWLKICVLDAYDCQSENSSNRRYTGYAALLVERAKPLSEAAPAPAPLSSPSYRVGPLLLPEHMHAGKTITRDVLVINDGSETWPASGTTEGKNVVNLAYVWLDGSGRVIAEGNRSGFSENIRSGDMAKISLSITAPSMPGRFTLVITPVQEGVRWFYRDSKSATGREMNIYEEHEGAFSLF